MFSPHFLQNQKKFTLEIPLIFTTCLTLPINSATVTNLNYLNTVKWKNKLRKYYTRNQNLNIYQAFVFD